MLLRFDKITVDYKAVPFFFWTQCSIVNRIVDIKCGVTVAELGFMSVLELELVAVKSRSVFLRWKNYSPESRRLLSWVVSYRNASVCCLCCF